MDMKAKPGFQNPYSQPGLPRSRISQSVVNLRASYPHIIISLVSLFRAGISVFPPEHRHLLRATSSLALGADPKQISKS